jgi:glyoxylate reductase
MYRGLDSRASGKNRKGKSMGKSLLVSNVLPAEALALIPKEISVDYHDSKDVLPRPELIARLRGKDGLICHIVSAIDDEVLAAAPTVKVVANVAVGYNNIDVEAARRRGVVVTNTPDVLTETTADFAWALLMASARRVVEADRFVRSGQWDRWLWDLLWGADVYGKTLGIVGFGRIGRAVARRALGFNMRVLYQDAVQADAAAERDLRASRVELETLLRESDFVSLHTPFLPETRHLMNARTLRLMKRSAILVNAARGPVVDEAALVRALQEGWIAGAGLDVFEEEPKVHPGLVPLTNVVLAPHIASASLDTRVAMATLAVRNCLAVLDGKTPLTPVP